MGIEEIIVSIHDAEAKADGILTDAADEARTVQIQAEEEAERIKKESAEKSKKNAVLMASNAEVAAAAKSNQRMSLGAKEAKKIYDSALENVPEAAEFIARRFVEKYVDS